MPSIKYKKKTYAGASFPVLEMTKAQYDALPEAKKMDGTVYMITDDTGGWEAENASYDNTESGLTATNVQDALDEIAKYPRAKVKRIYSPASTWTANSAGHIKFSTGLASNCIIMSVTPNLYATGNNLWVTIGYTNNAEVDIIWHNTGSATQSWNDGAWSILISYVET